MSLYALSPLQLLLLLGLSLSWLTLMYLLRRPARELRISSVLLWERVLEKRRKRPPDYWRRLLSWILLAILLGAGFVAIADPEFPTLVQGRRNLQIVLENGPSMLAAGSDDVSRWQRAREEIRMLLESEPATSRILLQPRRGSSLTARFRNPARTLEALAELRIDFSSSEPSLQIHPESEEVLLFTDRRQELSLSQAVQVVSLSHPVENVTLESFDVIPGPHREGVVRIHNRTAEPRLVEVVLADAAGTSRRREVKLQANEEGELRFDLAGLSPGPIRAAFSARDGFELDDSRYEWLPPERRRILLAGDRSRSLETLLSTYPELEPVYSGRDLKSVEGSPDAVILLNWAPEQAPSVPTMVIGAPSAPWLATVRGPLSDVDPIEWNRNHPLTAGIQGAELRLGRAWRVDAASYEVLASSPGGPLLLYFPAQPFWVQLPFLLEDSNLGGLPSFPILLDNFFNEAFGRGIQYAPLGEFDLPSGSRAWGPDGDELPVVPGVRSDAIRLQQPGVYSAITPAGRLQIVANVAPLDIPGEEGSMADSNLRLGSPVTWWKYLLALAASLLLGEWALFHRRLTV